MTTLVTADEKGRLPIRGTVRGRKYLVKREPEGWWVMPEPQVRPRNRQREWSGPRRDLCDHLDAMAEQGFVLERTLDAEVGPCRF